MSPFVDRFNRKALGVVGALVAIGGFMLIIFPLLNSWSASYRLFVGLAGVVAICFVCFLAMPNLLDMPDARSSQVEQARNDEPRRNLLAFP